MDRYSTSSEIASKSLAELLCGTDGSIGRECLNHVIVINERHLRRILKSYFGFYHRSRTHLLLDKDAPEFRPVQDLWVGRIIQIREVGGLHHRYERRAA